jgi:hypothetical protein
MSLVNVILVGVGWRNRSKTKNSEIKAARALMLFTGSPPLHPPVEPTVCQGVVFCECGLTLQEDGRREFTRLMKD